MGTLMNLAAVEAATPQVLETGMKIFSGVLYGATEAAHVDVLLQAMALPEDAVVLDAGCGVGEMARLMAEARPDLRFILLNLSESQLALCDPAMERMVGDFDAIPLSDASIDAVLFSYSLCHSPDWPTTLREARRVLKEGGSLFIADMLRLRGDNSEYEAMLGARVHYPEQIEAWAQQAGFSMELACSPEPVVGRLVELIGDDVTAERLLDGVVHALWRFRALDPIAAAFSRHKRIAFQFSAGRDSTAALYLLRPYWDRMTVYHVDTGDHFPETQAVLEAVARDVPVVVIPTDVAAYRAEVGMPSDLVPVDNTPFGRLVSGHQVKLVGRYDCCWANLMEPLHRKMVEDGITLLVRGQRDDEYAKPPMRSGDVLEGFEVLYPVQSWTADQVTAYLKAEGLPLAPFYEQGMRRAPECMGCTAWLDEGRAAYLRRNHPEQHAILVKRLETIRAEVDKQANFLNSELEA